MQNVLQATRHQLLRTLDLARAGRLIVLVAPPGYGKTTLLTQWWGRTRNESAIAAWYSASADDRNPVAFLAAVARSLEAAGLAPGAAFLPALEDAARGRLVLAVLATLEQTSAPITLIIDEFERIDCPDIADLIESIVLDAPENVTVVVAARRRPTFALSGLQARGLVKLVDASELQLDRAEIATLLPSAEQAADLDHAMATTEGWPIAVQLYRLWRARGSAPDMPLFTGRLGDMADYLTEQLLATLTPTCRDLIVDLSPFEFVEPALLDAARDRTDSALLLDELHRQLPGLVQHSFVEGLFTHRLHPLIADFGRSRLELDPRRARALDRRAGEWLWTNGRLPASIRYLLRSGTATELAAKLTELEVLPIFLAGGATALRAILREIPNPVIEAAPRLRLVAALAHFKTGLFGEAAAMLRSIALATGGFRVDPFGHHLDLRIEGLALELMFAVYMEGPGATDTPQIDTLLAIGGDRPLVRGWCENVMITLHQERGALEEARDAAARTARIYQASGVLPFSERYIRTHDMLIAYAQGALRKVGEMAGATGRRGEDEADPPLSAMARLIAAVVDYEQSYRATCGQAIQLALSQFGEGEAWFDQYALAYPVLADIGWRRDGLPGVLAVLAEVDGRLSRRGMNALRGYSELIEDHYRIRDGQPSLPTSADKPTSWRECDLRSHNDILALLGQGRPEEAERRAAGWCDDATGSGRGLARVRAQIMRAVAFEAAERPDEAEGALRAALQLALPERIVAPFLQEKRVLASLLARIAEASGPVAEKRHAAAVVALIRACARADPRHLLSPKENRILAYVADGASNKLIARQLGVSDNAIKFHLKRVYAKLGVSSRKAAVTAAGGQEPAHYPI